MSSHWVGSGWGLEATDPDQLLTIVSRLALLGRRYVWRGAGCAGWPVRSSLQRRLASSPEYFGTPEGYSPGITPLRYAEARIIEGARKWGLGFENGIYLNDLQLLALLQHHGAPTRLLDVTADPLTALWFACSDAEHADDDGVLFAFDVSKSSSLQTTPKPAHTLRSLADPLAWPLLSALDESEQTDRPVLLSPTVRDPRMIAQQGLFLVGREPRVAQREFSSSRWPEGSPVDVAGVEAFEFVSSGPPDWQFLTDMRSSDGPGPRVDFCAIVIPAAIKASMTTVLVQGYSKSVAALFPDVGGFVRAVTDQTWELPPAPSKVAPNIENEVHDATAQPWNDLDKEFRLAGY